MVLVAATSIEERVSSLVDNLVANVALEAQAILVMVVSRIFLLALCFLSHSILLSSESDSEELQSWLISGGNSPGNSRIFSFS